ncbi:MULTISPECIES: copper chaperone CopZ [Mesobacillus]|uniref:Copper chaperone CopZ n=2 Tax=Mesobacillus TaxID=2675231 RepID=A0A0D6Z983_9BACI|nr:MULTISPECIES: copper chaperone CopZ [Mesobacillus]KIY21571.1 copper-binding protein [Mesobacillus subterraneus]MDQ0411975.1 copper chaperone [Mesobacillus stamsii]
MEKTTLQVSGMTCGHCENAVKNAIMGVDGVASVMVSLSEGTAEVEYDASKAEISKMKAAVEEQGYDVE